MSDEDREALFDCYSVGSFGPFPISFYVEDGQFFYAPLEHDRRGPFLSIDEAVTDADADFGCTVGGFWRSEEEAESHADWMRNHGYVVE